MGIAIHYKGEIDKTETIDEFINEISDISKELGWKFNVIDDSLKRLKGVIILPHNKCESFSFLFDSRGTLRSPFMLTLDNIDEKSSIYTSVKTQYAPLDIHIAIIKLLKYIKSKYIRNLEVIDEAEYWDTMDKNILAKKMDFLASRINLVGDILDSVSDELSKAETQEGMLSKLEKLFKKMGFKFEENDN